MTLHDIIEVSYGSLGVERAGSDVLLKEDLEDTAGLLVDQARDTLDTTTASETADGGLGDALDVVAKDLAVTLGAALAETCRRVVSAESRERERRVCLPLPPLPRPDIV